MTDQTINWIQAIGTMVAVIAALGIAIFQDIMRTWFNRPELEVTIKLCPPDCHKTRYHLWITEGRGVHTTTLLSSTEDTPEISPTRSSSALGRTSTFTSSSPYALTADCGNWPAPSRSADVYCLRLRVSNSGKQRAESVEVIAAELKEKQADGTFSEVETFLPMNLLWSYYRQVFLPAISPETYKHCDLARIIDPKERKSFPGEHKTWANVSPEKTVLSFDTVVKPDTQSYLVPMGTYHLKIIVAAANAKPIEKTWEIILTGDWYDDEKEMLGRQGILIHPLQ